MILQTSWKRCVERNCRTRCTLTASKACVCGVCASARKGWRDVRSEVLGMEWRGNARSWSCGDREGIWRRRRRMKREKRATPGVRNGYVGGRGSAVSDRLGMILERNGTVELIDGSAKALDGEAVPCHLSRNDWMEPRFD